MASVGGIATPIRTDFNVTEKSKTWKKTTVKGILQKISSDAGITLYFSGQDYPIDELEQSNKTNQSFAFELCNSYNLAMKLYNRGMVVFDQTEYEAKKASLNINKTQLESWNIGKKMTRAYDGVSISYTDSKKNQTLSYKFMLKDGSRILKLNETAESLQDAVHFQRAIIAGTGVFFVRDSINIIFTVQLPEAGYIRAFYPGTTLTIPG